MGWLSVPSQGAYGLSTFAGENATDFASAGRACSLQSRCAVFQRHLLVMANIALGLTFDAVGGR